MKISGDWIEAKATQAVCTMLERGGYQALFVGGCVRNALLNVPVRDIDIATDAQPEKVIQLAKAAGLKPVPTGLEHGTITVVSHHVPFEITTFRKDVETDGRRAVVAFSTEVEDDARRRDFTMNALYARPDGTVIDPLGGLGDLRARRFRFIEDADRRIQEDYLRILRFFRFNAWYGDPEVGLDAEAMAAIAGNLDGLPGLSRERVGAEMLKLLDAADPVFAVAAMRSAGVLQAVLPGADITALGPLIHLEQQIGQAPDALRRLAALGGEDVVERLRLSKVQVQGLALRRALVGETMGAAEMAYRHGADVAQDVLLLRSALLERLLDPVDLSEIKTGAEAKFPLRAADFQPHLSGPALGQALKRAESRWIESGFTLNRAELLAE